MIINYEVRETHLMDECETKREIMRKEKSE